MATSSQKTCWEAALSSMRRWYQIPTRILCLAVVLLQACMLDYFLVFYNNYLWCLWAVADVAVAVVFLVAMILSYRLFKREQPSLGVVCSNEKETRQSVQKPVQIGGELPLGYLAWLLYTAVLSAKIGILFGSDQYIVQKLSSRDIFGPSMMRISLALSSIVFFLFIHTHHNAPDKSEREAFMESLGNSVAVDLLDATQFLDVLYLSESHIMLSYEVHRAVIAVACIMFILPFLLLLSLSHTRFGLHALWLSRLKFMHRVLYFLAVNIPTLVLRVVIWHVHKKEASVFLIKNIISVGIAFSEMHKRLLEAAEKSKKPVSAEEFDLQALNSPANTATDNQLQSVLPETSDNNAQS